MFSNLGSFYLFVLAYLLGSIPFGLILTRLSGRGDVRHIGSGNIGATNVLRTGNKFLAFLTFLFDALKGVLAVFVARYFNIEAEPIAAIAVILGHMFPIWLRFKGGKGVATAIGVYFMLYFPVAIAAIFVWVFIAFLTRYSSLASLFATGFAPILAYVMTDTKTSLTMLVMAVLIFIKHSANIRRLFDGKELKIGQKGSGHDKSAPES
jgi:glycerol-3-phosphate acyltransferase PlsY